jgi:membrane protein DedA with SNARE-associated domain
MEKWEIIILICVVGILTSQAVYQVGRLIGARLDEIDEKINKKLDAMQEKLDEIEANQDRKPYVNPIDL